VREGRQFETDDTEIGRGPVICTHLFEDKLQCRVLLYLITGVLVS
jgi:hypothetical protein